MSTAKVTAFDARGHIEQLQAAGYRLPDGTTIERLAKIWGDVLEGITIDELADAVRTYLRDGSRYWPKPYEIRQIALDARREAGHVVGGGGDLRSRYRAWEQHNADGSPCPVCGAVLQSLTAAQRGAPEGAPPRYGVYHDVGEHRRRKVPHVGYPVSKDHEGVA